jgi:hypothetical protein
LEVEREAQLILREAAELKASKLIDKVYGLLGMLPERIQASSYLDYNKPPEEILFDFVNAYLEVYRHLSLIRDFRPYSDAQPSAAAPTWLPHICSRSRGLPSSVYHAAGTNNETFIAPSRTILVAKGVIIGMVKGTMGMQPTDDLRARHVEEGKRWRDMEYFVVGLAYVDEAVSGQSGKTDNETTFWIR